MKKIYFLLLAGAMILCACQKEGPSVPPAPSRLPAEICQAFAENHQGVFQLNEGQMGTNSATLDFLRFANGHYSRNIFRASGSAVPLGDVGNDLAVKGDELWMVINNSGIVQVISKTDCSEIAAIQVPMPRNIAFDDTYAYVTSWAGAYAQYNEDYSQIISYDNPKGKVYRINLATKLVDEQTVEVGYQPEGIAYYNGKLYVANSGGIACKVPPDYQYGKTISAIKTATFNSVETEIEVGFNPKNVIAAGDRIYVTTLGDYYTNHSAFYYISTLTNRASKQADYVTAVSVCGNTVYGIGTEDEFDFSKPSKAYFAWKWTMTGGCVRLPSPVVSGTALSGLCVLQSGEDLLWMVTDQGDYVNPGSLDFYWKGEKAWSVTTGICPGHFAVL